MVKQLTVQSSTSLEDDQIQVADISQVCLEGTKQQLSNQLSNGQQNPVTSGVWVSQGLKPDNQDKVLSPPEACSPSSCEASIVQAHTLTYELQQAQYLQGSVTNNSKGPIPTSEPHLHIPDNQCDATSLAEAYSPPPGEASSDQTIPLTCEVKHVQSLQASITHDSEDGQLTSEGHPRI